MIHFRCPRCGVRLKGRDRSAGHKRTCPGCGSKVQVPVAAGPAPPELWDSEGPGSSRPDLTPASDSTRHESVGSSVLVTASSRVAPEDVSFLMEPQGQGEIGRLGAFRILEVLGAGSTGIVFRAEDTRLRRLVALKVLRPAIAANAESRRRFLREARAAAAFDHENILTIYHVGEDRGIPWLAMKLLRGQSLKDRLSGPDLFLPTDHVLRIGAEVADALAVAHSGGLVHRDVKPSNILLEEGSDRVKLIDFGLVLVDDEEGQLTRTGCVVGTPAYMAPEQADGAQVDYRCDLYGLGCVLYRSSTGRLPFEGQTYMQVFFAQRTQTPVYPRAINPEVPPSLADLVMNLMAINPADRPPSAGVVRDALRDLRSKTSGGALQQQTTSQTLVGGGTDQVPALPAESAPAANPWAEVMVDVQRDSSTENKSLASRIPPWLADRRVRWLWAAAAVSIGLLTLAILLATRH